MAGDGVGGFMPSFTTGGEEETASKEEDAAGAYLCRNWSVECENKGGRSLIAGAGDEAWAQPTDQPNNFERVQLLVSKRKIISSFSNDPPLG
ncbi:hypothetical protein MRB53_026848 [Persea americana]|uniref:Uncharacterized protein n=1 Tax=Persea americana TaxID=3435 RepID=A0ACC2LK90_PERAE|nr:hypothetical protein MRB53_026848 [Persea americana]